MMRTQKRLHILLLGVVMYVSLFLSYSPIARPGSEARLFVAPIEGVINLGLAPFVRRVLDETTAADATAVKLDINTFGGRIDAAVLIRDALLESRILTVTFSINGQFQPGLLPYE